MENAKVLHLVSNSTTFPSNTATEFKIAYNTPFDLTGKRIALVDATLTKAQANIRGEVITFSFTQPIPTLVTHDCSANNTEGDYYDRFNGHILSQSNKTLAKISSSVSRLPPSRPLLSIKVENTTTKDAKVSYYSAPEEGDTQKSIWKDHTGGGIIATNEENGVELISTSSEQHSNGGYLKTWKIPARKTATFVFSKLPNSSETPGTENAPGYNSNTFFQVSAFDVEGGGGGHLIETSERVQLSPGYYDNVNSLLRRINNMPTFSKYATIKQRFGHVVIKVKSSTPSCIVSLGGTERHFGFDKRILHHKKGVQSRFTSNRPPDLTRGVHHFYIYCSLVKHVAVNEKQLQLLATVDATKGSYGDQVVHPVQYPLFVDCVEGPQQLIEVTIADDMGNIKGLLMGRTKLTLAIRDA